MDEQKKMSPFEFSIEELDRELIARGAQVPDVKKFNFNDKVGTPSREAIMTRTQKVYQNPPPTQ